MPPVGRETRFDAVDWNARTDANFASSETTGFSEAAFGRPPSAARVTSTVVTPASVFAAATFGSAKARTATTTASFGAPTASIVASAPARIAERTGARAPTPNRRAKPDAVVI